MVKTFGRTWLTTVTAMAGRAIDARREFEAIEWWAQDPDACMFDPYRSLAETWVCAAEDAVSQAISIMRDAAERMPRGPDPRVTGRDDPATVHGPSA